MRDTAEAISRGADIPVEWIRGSLEDLMWCDDLTLDEAYVEVRVGYEATFHALVHRSLVAMGPAFGDAGRRAGRGWTPR
jgi:hypothetical protein